MNAVELQQAVDAVAARMDVVTDGDARTVHRNDAVVVFAGTDLPGHAVLSWLSEEINEQLPRVKDLGLVAVLQGVALNTFMLGFECGRRSK